jgi:hypothetical protein
LRRCRRRRGAAFVHDGRIVSATRNLGPCTGWSVDRFERMCAAHGWTIARDEPAEGSRAEMGRRAGDR